MSSKMNNSGSILLYLSRFYREIMKVRCQISPVVIYRFKNQKIITKQIPLLDLKQTPKIEEHDFILI